ANSVRVSDVRHVRGRLFQPGSPQFRPGGEFETGPAPGTRPLLRAAEPVALRYHEPGRAWPAGRMALHDRDDGVRVRVRRDIAHPRRHHFFAQGLQVTGRSRLSIVYAVVAMITLGAISVGLQMLRDARYPLPVSDEETLYLNRRATSRLVFTHRSLVADVYWVRALQYYGAHTQQAQRQGATFLAPPSALAADPPVSFDLLYPLLDISTTLDPRFNIAYRFGSIFLSEGYPHGPGRPDQAVALLEKGLKTSPDKWQYWQDIGFVYYWNSQNYEKAAAAFPRGADTPGAPWCLRSLAASTLAKGGDRTASRLLWRQLAETANNEYARNAAQLKLKQLDAIEIVEKPQKGIDAVAARRGAPVTSWNELIAARLIPGAPLDPAGVPFELDSTSRVTVSAQSPLFPLPFEPAARSGT